MKVGVLALQGGFREHIHCLQQLDIECCEIRLPAQLKEISGLIIPGGESTSISKLLQNYNLYKPIKQAATQGLAIWGTCAGAILLATNVDSLPHPSFGLIDMTIERNGYGSQVDSFETEVTVDNNISDTTIPGIFIRAPIITSVSSPTNTIATIHQNKIVGVQQNQFLATTFHPELTNDLTIHRYFTQQLI